MPFITQLGLQLDHCKLTLNKKGHNHIQQNTYYNDHQHDKIRIYNQWAGALICIEKDAGEIEY